MLPKFSSDAVENESGSMVERVAGRRGSIATQTALVLPVLMGFTALAVDSAYLFVEQTHQQAAVDGASLAALSGYYESDAVLRSRALTAMGYNKSIVGAAYTLDSNTDVETGYWSGTAFVPADFTTARNQDRPAVRITSPGQTTNLFFARLFTPSGTTLVKTQAVAARMVIGDGPPANCGILADATLEIGGSQTADGYVSDDCLSGSLGYSIGTRDPATGVCANGSAEVYGGAGNNLYASISWGPDNNLITHGSPAMHGPSMQLADEVVVPDPETCSAGELAASNAFLAAIPAACVTDGSVSDVAVDFVHTCRAGDTCNEAFPDVDLGNVTFEMNSACGAPQVLCINDLDLGSTAEFVTDGESWGSGQAVKIKASGNLSMTGSALLANESDTNVSTGVSTGNAAGALELHVQGDVALRGTTDLSAILTVGGNLSFLGNTDVYGAMYADGNILMSGNFDVHVDRCYEISTTRHNGNTETISLPKVVIVQ